MLFTVSAFVFWIFAEVLCRGTAGCSCPLRPRWLLLLLRRGRGEPQRACTRSSEYGCGMAVGMAIPRVFVMSVRGCCPVRFRFPPCIPSVHLCDTSVQVSRAASRRHRSPGKHRPKHQTPCIKPCSFPLSILCRTVFCTLLCCWGRR